MKNTFKFLLITALVAVIGFSMVACDDKIDDDPISNNTTLHGTWLDSAGDRMVLNINGSYSIYDGNVEIIRGTYSTNGNNISMTTTQIHGSLYEGEMGISETQWYTQTQLMNTVIDYFTEELIEELMEEFGEDLTQEELEEIIDELIDELREELEEDFGVLFGTQTGTYSISDNKLTLTLGGATAIFTKQ